MIVDPQLSRDSSPSPFIITVASLSRQPGSLITCVEQRIAHEPIGLDLISIPAGQPITLDLQCQSVSEGILVTGHISGPLEGECTRCLNPIQTTIDVEITELFFYSHDTFKTTHDHPHDDQDQYVIGETIDLYQTIIDAVGLALPFAPLCRPDCLGLCPECGISLNEADPNHHHQTIDPRWQQLAHLFDQPPTTEMNS